MSGAFSVVNILADSVGPGTVGIHGDSQHYFLSSGNLSRQIGCFLLLNSLEQDNCGSHFWTPHCFFPAFMTMAIILLHMFWGVVFFDACEKQRWWAVAAVVISHLIVSCLVSVAASPASASPHPIRWTRLLVDLLEPDGTSHGSIDLVRVYLQDLYT